MKLILFLSILLLTSGLMAKEKKNSLGLQTTLYREIYFRTYKGSTASSGDYKVIDVQQLNGTLISLTYERKVIRKKRFTISLGISGDSPTKKSDPIYGLRWYAKPAVEFHRKIYAGGHVGGIRYLKNDYTTSLTAWHFAGLVGINCGDVAVEFSYNSDTIRDPGSRSNVHNYLILGILVAL